MTKFIKLILVALSIAGGSLSLRAADPKFADETLRYVISYKWGLIHKDAGDAVLSLRNNGDKYILTLTGKTLPWADKFFEVRDTLRAEVLKDGFKPVSYVKTAHEDGKYSRDEITYAYAGNVVGGDAVRTRVSKKGERSSSTKKLTASGATFDMLSVFYFLRTIDYAALTSGKRVKASIFSGSKVETLTIRCVGRETVKLRDKRKVEAYHIKFNFTQEGRKKSSDDIDAWISADGAHIPLQVIGSLPVGQVRCFLL